MDYFDQSQELINKILKSLTEVVISPWEQIQLTAEFGTGVLTLKGNFTYNGIVKSFKSPIQTHSLLLKLQKLNSNAQKGLLKKAVFTVGNDGKFDVKYDY